MLYIFICNFKHHRLLRNKTIVFKLFSCSSRVQSEFSFIDALTHIKDSSNHDISNIYIRKKIHSTENELSMAGYLKTNCHSHNHPIDDHLIIKQKSLKSLLRFFIDGKHDCYSDSTHREFQFKHEDVFQSVRKAWVNGNIVSSMNQFSDMYTKGDKVLKKKLIKTLQHLIFRSIKTNGMAIINNIIQNVKKFSIEYNEYSLLLTLWYGLFISNLYEDNCSSASLLEVQEFKKYLEAFVPYFGVYFLKRDELGLYQRLIETTLSHRMDNEAGILLRILFDYYYKNGYIQGCAAVYDCCIHLNIKLTRDQLYKYNLLQKTDRENKNKLFDRYHPKDMIYKF